MWEKIIAFVFGSVVGSFLNVCIHRMPLEESVVKPRSHCPHCKKTIPWFDNIPIISYIILGASCRYCKQRISFRYFLVELITGLTFLAFFNLFGLSFSSLFYTIFACGLIVATFVDIQHRIIPDEISLGGVVVGFLLSAIKGFYHHNPAYYLLSTTYNLSPLLESFLGIVVGGGTIYLTGKFFDIIYFKLLKRPPIQGETESMGGGDVKLLAMIGAFLGWQKALATFFLAPFLGLALGLINLISKKDHTIPYGPFLSIAAVISLLWFDKILRLIFFMQ